MSELKTVQIPDIGDTDSVEVIEVLVQVGTQLQIDDSLITVESDKASMEIPSPFAGTVTSMLVKQGDQVSMGSDILVMDITTAETAATETDTKPTAVEKPTPATAEAATSVPDANSQAALDAADERCDVVVIGAGPGGYTAAFRAADLGQSVIMVERYPNLGGVCLNVGCIPSKALLHTAQVINEVEGMAAHGVTFSKPEIDIDKLRKFKESVIGQLTGGLKGLSKQRKIKIVQGTAKFTSANSIAVEHAGENRSIGFDHAIIAAGSQSIQIPGFPYDDDRLIDSTGALELRDIPARLLVIGGGIIGLEMGCVYAALGTKVTIVELSDSLMPGTDPDLVRPLQKRLAKQFENIFLDSKVSKIESDDAGLRVTFEGGKAPEQDSFERVLLAVGRAPNGNKIDAAKAGVNVDERGFIAVDNQMRTNVPNIHAIGDVVGQPMLAHKATHEGKVAAEVICGKKSWFDPKTIPSVAYTDPEVAWMGLTETQAKAENIPYEKGVFPWAASGRSLSIARNEGFTKVLHDPETGQVLGAGIVGTSAGELIAEMVLALEMGADIEDIGLTIHPHPTLSETVGLACEVAEGTVTDIYAPKSR